MTNLVPLDKDQHSELRIITHHGKEYGENVHLTPIVATELQSLVLDYPCALMKDEQTGHFGLYALLGFENNENLYLQQDQWRASYIPLHIRRQPFVSVTAQNQQGRGNLLIDLDSARVNKEQGEPLFNTDGTNSQYLQNTQQLLGALMGGIQASQAFVQTLTELALLEPIKLDIAFASGQKQTYQGLYSVSAEKLSALQGKNLQTVHERGYLNACHYLLASLGHIRKLVDWKNAQEPSQ
ncbi:SapC family protein [Gilvimarinus chinensis]|uniref:SapC family protein n=1 Tax=Gilvimarinus chinensis TaxID=396005 RepID=UPI00036EB2AE|nr:SapC family protein [Gilvimarinus chinensis]